MSGKENSGSNNRNRKALLAVAAAVLAVTLAVFGGEINSTLAHCRHKYIDEPIARRIVNAREKQREQQVEFSGVIQSPLMDDAHRGDSAQQTQPYTPSFGKSMMRSGSVVPME